MANRTDWHRVCAACSADFLGRYKSKYCSAECRKSVPKVAWNRGEKRGFIPRSAGEWRACRQCGKPWWKSPSQAQSIYCSMKCYFECRWGNRQTNRADNRVCCSKPCRQHTQATRYLGEKSHFWRGGATAPYHTEWKPQRRKALERDGHACVLCGGKDKVNVHHKNPFRYSQSHALENLISLCRSCHSKEELKVNAAMRQSLALGRNPIACPYPRTRKAHKKN
jgi:5-methylcytosine-specific restriction endonuclease McrA